MSFPSPPGSIDELLTAAERAFQVALAPIPPALLELRDPMTELDIVVLVPIDARWQLGHFALDAFGTSLSDTFGSMRLWPPTTSPPWVILHARVGAPAAAADELAARMHDALADLISGLVGDDVLVRVTRPDTVVED